MGKRLFKSVYVFLLLLVTFFSNGLKSNAASFQYSQFNWDKFLESNENFWVPYCEEDDEECKDKILVTQERFYTRLYELLAKYESKGWKIDDRYIIATIFYGLNPDSFHDPDLGEDYEPYNIDDKDDSLTKDMFIGDDDGDSVRAKDYFDKETDSLKSLLNNYIGYASSCYVEANETPSQVTDPETGNKYMTCSNYEYREKGNKCVENIEKFKGSFFDSIGISSLGENTKEKCQNLASEKGRVYYDVETSDDKEADIEFYWNFLENSNYLDLKAHLRVRYELVLNQSGYKNMKDFHENASDEEKEKYKDIIIRTRKRIISSIKSIVETFEDINGNLQNDSMNCVGGDSYWWPIGSNEITEVNGVKMAVGDPANTVVSSPFGMRTHPIYGTKRMHKGVDIGGIDGKTPLIATKSGVVVLGATGTTGTCVNGDQSCGGGYGNYIMIQHTDGNYSLYAHMATGSVIVKEGETVSQGQVVGMVGNTGASTGGHIHFEIRVGGDSSDNVQDPLTFISAEDPRSSSGGGTCGGGKLEDWIGAIELASQDKDKGPGDNYLVYNIGDGSLTFGKGITHNWNADVIRAHGIDPYSLHVGSAIPYETAEAIFLEVIHQHEDKVRQMLSQNGLTLNEDQVTALVSLDFNSGNTSGFLAAYKKYGSTQALCDNWWVGSKLRAGFGGLPKRRAAECNVFVKGEYNYNPYG